MSPLEVRVMLHYHCSLTDWEGPEDKNFMFKLHQKMIRQDMLARAREDEFGPQYLITPKGRAYVQMVLDVPVPIVNYVDPRTL